MSLERELDMLLAENSIFLNPDIVSEIIKHFDYLNTKDRICISKIIENIVDKDVTKTILPQVIQSRRSYMKDNYVSTRLSGTITIPNMWPWGNVTCIYWFTVQYDKNKLYQYPTINENILRNIIGALYTIPYKTDGLDTIQYLIGDRCGIICCDSGIAGEIITPDKIVDIYCNNPGDHMVTITANSTTAPTILAQEWYRDNVPHRLDGPAITKYNAQGICTYSDWYRNGELYRKYEDGPMSMRYLGQYRVEINTNGISYKGIIYKHDIKYMEICYIDLRLNSGYLFYDYVNLDDWLSIIQGNYLLQDVDKPAVITYYPSGTIETEIWYIEGKISRDIYPAITKYYENGNKYQEIWYVEDRLYRSGDLPAIIEYHETGNKYQEIWFQNTRVHRSIPVYLIIRMTYHNLIWDIGNMHYGESLNNGEIIQRPNNLPSWIIYADNGDITDQIWYENGKRTKVKYGASHNPEL